MRTKQGSYLALLAAVLPPHAARSEAPCNSRATSTPQLWRRRLRWALALRAGCVAVVALGLHTLVLMTGARAVVVLMALAVSALLGCAASAVTRGADYYRQGRHIDADLVFQHGEPQLSQLEVGERARYALYRGSNYLVLGDRRAAKRWLEYGASLSSASPAAFSLAEQALLQRGLRAMGVPVAGSTVSGSTDSGGKAAGVSTLRALGW